MCQSNNQTMVRVHKRENPYVMIDKTCLNDIRLSWKSKGLLCYLLSLPDNWQIHIKELKNHSSDGRDSTASALKELIEFGYCTREVNRDENGKLRGYIYNIFELPIENSTYETPENTELEPKTDFPNTVKPNTENPKLLNNNKTNNNKTNKLVCQSCINTHEEKKNDGAKRKNIITKSNNNKLIDESLKYKLEQSVIENKINELEINETYDENTSQAIKDALEYIYTSNKTIKNHKKDIRQKNFVRINKKHIDNAVWKFNNTNTSIKFPLGYFATCIYNSINELSVNNLNLKNKIEKLQLE